MIHPDAQIVDLDPGEWARLAAILRAAAPPPRRVVSVLHDRGQVLRAHDTERGLLRSPRRITSAKRDAARILKATGADRVIVADRAALEEFQRQAEERDFREMALLDWLAWRERLLAERFASRIVILPSPFEGTGPLSYPKVKAFVERIGEGVVTAAVYEDGVRILSGIARVVEKRVVLFATFDALASKGTFAGAAEWPAALKAAADRFGPLKAGVRVPRALFESLLAGAPAKALAESLKRGESAGDGGNPDALAAILGLFRFVGPGVVGYTFRV